MASPNRLPVFAYAAAAVRLVADAAFPPRCPSCRAHVSADGNFCSTCFQQLRLIADPLCDCCGIPFAVPMGEGARCPECLDDMPDFEKARSVMVYDNISAPLISSLKFNDQWAGIERYVQMMQAAGAQALAGVELIVPVPLHWRRLVGRKFNQSAVLGFGLSRLTGIPCHPEMLQRVVHTKPQMRLDRATRMKNVRAAFAVPPLANGAIHGKTVLLVDDVVTTGATANACARALKKAGAREVRVLSLARTVKE